MIGRVCDRVVTHFEHGHGVRAATPTSREAGFSTANDLLDGLHI